MVYAAPCTHSRLYHILYRETGDTTNVIFTIFTIISSRKVAGLDLTWHKNFIIIIAQFRKRSQNEHLKNGVKTKIQNSASI